MIFFIFCLPTRQGSVSIWFIAVFPALSTIPDASGFT